MKHVRVILTESGGAVEVERIIHGPRKRSVEQRTRQQLRQIIERVLKDHPNTACDSMAEALRHGYWWTDLDGEPFTVMVLTPDAVERADRAVVEITVESGVVSDVQAPPGVRVLIRDYDTDGADRSRLQHDRDGRACVITTWGGAAGDDASLPKLSDHLRGKGFAVVTHNQNNDPDSRFEAWAYEGPLDFDNASALCFGIGADPVEALDALNGQLSRMSD